MLRENNGVSTIVPESGTDRGALQFELQGARHNRCAAWTTWRDNVKKERDIQMDERPVTRDPEGDDEDVDGCEVEIENPTPDEDLPAAEGGIA
jgi:hypothetical protein